VDFPESLALFFLRRIGNRPGADFEPRANVLLEARFNQNRPGAWERHKMLEKA
jgi:hypothetical protein